MRALQAAEHDHPVQALGPDCTYPAFGERVGSRSPDRSPDDAHPFGSEDLVEGTGVLRVSVPAHQPNPLEPLPDRQVASLLADPRRVGVSGDTEYVHLSGSELDREQHVQGAKPNDSAVKKSNARIP